MPLTHKFWLILIEIIEFRNETVVLFLTISKSKIIEQQDVSFIRLILDLGGES